MKTKEESKEVKPCPTVGGTFEGYLPEYLDPRKKDKTWLPVPLTRKPDGSGALYPLSGGGILQTIGLLGYEQAQAIAWKLAASAQSEGVTIVTRIATYKVVFDIKAYRTGEENL